MRIGLVLVLMALGGCRDQAPDLPTFLGTYDLVSIGEDLLPAVDTVSDLGTIRHVSRGHLFLGLDVFQISSTRYETFVNSDAQTSYFDDSVVGTWTESNGTITLRYGDLRWAVHLTGEDITVPPGTWPAENRAWKFKHLPE